MQINAFDKTALLALDTIRDSNDTSAHARSAFERISIKGRTSKHGYTWTSASVDGVSSELLHVRSKTRALLKRPFHSHNESVASQRVIRSVGMADQSTVVEAIDTTSAENSLKLAFNVEAVKKVATVHVKLREMASRFSSSSKFREILLELSRRAADLRRECYSSAEKSEECVTIIVDEIIPTIREGDDDDDDDLDELSVELNEKIEETKIRTDRNLDETKKVIAFADQISTHRHVKEEERDRVRMKETIEEKHSIAERSAKETEKSLRQAERETTHSRRNAEWAEETSSPVYMFLFKPFLTVYKWHHEKKAYASDGTVQGKTTIK